MKTMNGQRRDESGEFGSNIARVARIVLVVGLAAATVFAWLPADAAVPTVSQFDLKVDSLKVISSPAGGTEMSVVKEGSDVYIYCSWKATTKEDLYNVAKEIKFTNAISIDGKQLATVDDRVTPGQYGGIYKENLHVRSIAKKWKAAGPGKHTIQCKLDLTDQFKEKPGWKEDSQRTIQLVVRRDLKEGEIPAPIMLNPPAGAQYQRGDNIKIPIGFRVDDAFLNLSKDLIIPQVWFRMELEYDGPPGARSVQKKTAILSNQYFGGGYSLMTNNPLEDHLTMQEMKKQGVGEEGHYTLTVYLLVGKMHGPKARRSFNIHGPLGVKGKTGTEVQGVSPPAPIPKAPVPPPRIPPQPPKGSVPSRK